MSQAEKRLARMKENPKGWRYEEVAATLEVHGFRRSNRHSRGSHRVFRHPSGLRVVIPDHGSGTLLPVYVEKAVEQIEKVRKEGQ